MKKSGYIFIIVSVLFGFLLVESVLGAASQTQQAVASQDQSPTNQQLALPPRSAEFDNEEVILDPSPIAEQIVNREVGMGVAGQSSNLDDSDLSPAITDHYQQNGNSSQFTQSQFPNQPEALLSIQVNYAHNWVAGITDPGATVLVTVTNNEEVVKAEAIITADGGSGEFFVGCEDWIAGWCPNILPGDHVKVASDGLAQEISPVGSINGFLDEVENTVDGILNVSGIAETYDVECVVWEEPGSDVITATTSTAGGTFSCDFDDVGWDLQFGQQTAVSYYEPDGDRVINILTWPWARVNYAHDWVAADYPADHTFFYTVSYNSNDVKAFGSDQTEINGGWGGDGFQSQDWTPEHPDIQSWDLVHFTADTGFTKTIQVGEINGAVDVAADVVAGTIVADFPGMTLTVECHPWGAWEMGLGDIPVKESSAAADGSEPFSCDWSGEWDILPGQDIAVMYIEPDHDRVINVVREPVAYLRIWKSAHSEPAEGGNYRFTVDYWNQGDAPAENVVISDTMEGLIYLADTTSLSHSGSGSEGDPIVWELGTVLPGEAGSFEVFVQVTALSTEDVTNSVEIDSTSYLQGEPWERQSTRVRTVVPNNTHLNVTKGAKTDDPAPGYDIVFEINVCNHGSTASSEVILEDHLQAPEMVLEDWWAETPGWSENSSTASELILSIPTIAGGNCGVVYIRAGIEPWVEPGTPLTNFAQISSSSDLETEDNQATWESAASIPHSNLGIVKDWAGGELVPGGVINYHISFYNNGNIPVGFWMTDTFPISTTFISAWYHDPDGGYPYEPDLVTGEFATWEVPELENGMGGEFSIQLQVDPNLEPGTTLENWAEISPLPGEDRYDDNLSNWIETLNAPGPNLRVHKWSSWNEWGGLRYNVRFENIGSETVTDFWIQDTLPLSTTWNGEWWMEFDETRLSVFTPTTGVLEWVFTEIHPGETGWLFFNANLDEPVVPLQWFTNTVEIMIPSGDPTPDDNIWNDVAFSGGEVYQVHIWFTEYGDSNMWGRAIPDTVVSVTTTLDVFTTIANPDCGGCWEIENTGLILPGNEVIVEAGAGIQPVTITVPTPFDAEGSSMTDLVSGQVDHLDQEWLEVDLYRGPSYLVQTDDDGNFASTFPDIPRGGEGEVRYPTKVDYTDVTFHRYWRSPDLILEINYGHDWIQGAYEAGHTIWLTVTESDTATVKSTAHFTSSLMPGWETSGFNTDFSGWDGDRPDIQPGDWVLGMVDNGFYNEVRIGDISGMVDSKNDSISGTLDIDWFENVIATLPVTCHPWGAWELGFDAPQKHSFASPDGTQPYFCAWDPVTEWDIQMAQILGVSYLEPDGDRIFNVFMDLAKVYLPLLLR